MGAGTIKSQQVTKWDVFLGQCRPMCPHFSTAAYQKYRKDKNKSRRIRETAKKGKKQSIVFLRRQSWNNSASMCNIKWLVCWKWEKEQSDSSSPVDVTSKTASDGETAEEVDHVGTSGMRSASTTGNDLVVQSSRLAHRKCCLWRATDADLRCDVIAKSHRRQTAGTASDHLIRSGVDRPPTYSLHETCTTD